MAKTESVEALLSPSLRVSRPVAACARCRSAKIKCDGKLPACSACERAGRARECSSANDDFAKGKERSYVAALETAIQRLHKQIKGARASNELVQQTQYGSNAAHGRPNFQRRPMSGTRRKEAFDVDELVSDLGFLTVNATSRDFHGFTSTMSFARLLMAIAAKKPLPQIQELPLASRYTITPLVDHYFANIYVLLPFFSETAFMSSLSKVCQDSVPTLAVAPIDHWYVRLVLAISAASTCTSKGDPQYETAMQHISAAMKFAELVIHPGSIAGIQALLLLVQYSLVDPEHFDSWYLIGMASRLLVDLGLHCEPPSENKLSRHALDLRRRVFYCTYALDRQISMANSFAYSFTDDSAPNVLLPTLAIDLEKRSPTQLFLRSVRPSLFLFDIRRVQSATYQATRFSSRKEWSVAFANEYVNGILNDVRAWHASVPTSFDQRHLQFFFVEFLYSQILAVAPSPTFPVTNMSDAQQALVFRLATQFADQMQLMVRQPESQAFLTFADVCRARYVGQQFQSVIWSSFDQILLSPHALAGTIERSSNNVTPLDTCTRAISFIDKTVMILDFARTRWGISDLRESFEQETAVLLARLRSKQQECGRESLVAASTYPTSAPSFPLDAGDGLTSTGFESGSFATTHSPTQALVHPAHDFTTAAATTASPAMHRSNLMTSSWAGDGQPGLELPPGSLPRRSYEFMGNPAND